MNTYCKDINIKDENLIETAVFDCLQKKYKRRDTFTLLSEVSGIGIDELKSRYKEKGKAGLSDVVRLLIPVIRDEIKNRKLILKPIIYKTKDDPSSGKPRRIGVQSVKQQIYDYVAVAGLRPFLKRIGEFQVASIKGRGQSYGAKYVKRWLRNKNIRYGAKADVRRCYESIDPKRLMKFLRKHVKNDDLLWLIETLLNTFEHGLSIGSYLSQFLCNVYLSQLYHEISENMYRIRKHKNGTQERINLVKHVIFFMDDILIFGTNKKDIHKAVDLIQAFAYTQLGLNLKPNWFVFMAKVGDKRDEKGQFVDMMGFRFYRRHTTIRQRVFLRIRRSYMKALKLIKTHKPIPLKLARRCISYYGQIKNSDSCKFKAKYKVGKIREICRKAVQNYDKSIIYKRAAGSYC